MAECDSSGMRNSPAEEDLKTKKNQSTAKFVGDGWKLKSFSLSRTLSAFIKVIYHLQVEDEKKEITWLCDFVVEERSERENPLRRTQD